MLIVLVFSYVGTCFSHRVWAVREDGVGPVKIGMSLPELNKVLAENFSVPDDKEEQGCFYVNPGKHPEFAFMILDGHLARIDVSTPGVFTSKGAQVGDTEAQVLKIYGDRMKVEPHHYNAPEGHYLTAQSSDGSYGIRFETENGKIDMFYAGSVSAIHFVEGCQ